MVEPVLYLMALFVQMMEEESFATGRAMEGGLETQLLPIPSNICVVDRDDEGRE